jgi:hypothetical protein
MWRDGGAMTQHETAIDGSLVVLDHNAIDLDTLEAISFWREDLSRRLSRTQPIFLFADAGVDFSSLSAEVAAFKKCCRVVAWRPEAA